MLIISIHWPRFKTANFWYPVLSGGTDANGTGTGFWKQPSAENQETFDHYKTLK